MKPIPYADKTDHWTAWWHGYKYGAFYIFPPETIMQEVDALRETYDPKSASFCRAHISLSEPLKHKITEAEVASLRRDLAVIDPFGIAYGPLQTHPPHPGVTYRIGPEDTFAALRKIIHSNPIFDKVEIKRSTIVPHMTVAEFVSMERTEQIFEELKDQVESGSFLCESIILAVPDNDFYFHPVLAIPLGKRG